MHSVSDQMAVGVLWKTEKFAYSCYRSPLSEKKREREKEK